jgi:tetratricopeptide (TPR) repeat protein
LDSLKYTWQLITTVSPQATMVNYNMIELASPLGSLSRTFTAFWFYFALLAAFPIGLIAVALHCRQQLSLARTLIGCAMLATSMTGIRNMPLFAIVAAPLIAENLSQLDSARLRRICGATAAVVVIIAALVWSPRPALTHLGTWVPYRFGVGMSSDYVPLGLPAFLDQIGFSGPIFNSQTLGGFYEYQGSPKRIPFYDYRLEDYDLKKLQAVYAATYTAYADPTAWHDLMQRYGFRGLLLENGSPAETAGLLPLITVDPGWRLVYLDYAASFWIRSDQPQLPPAVDRTVVEDLATGITNFAQAENLNSFLEKTHRYPDIRLQILEQASRHGESATLLTDLGLLKMQSGHLAEADQLFNRVLRIKPRSQRTLATLAQIALSRGDNRAAEKYLQKALSYYPNDPELRENYDIVLRSIGK